MQIRAPNKKDNGGKKNYGICEIRTRSGEKKKNIIFGPKPQKQKIEKKYRRATRRTSTSKRKKNIIFGPLPRTHPLDARDRPPARPAPARLTPEPENS